MPVFETRNFGPISYEPGDALKFPRGLPAFENCRQFLALTLPQSEPLVFLQSLEDGGLCFITVPVLVVDRDYRLRMAPEDLELIGLPSGAALRIGQQVLCLAVLSMREEGPTANLLAPIVVNMHDRRAVQAVAPESVYSHQHPLMPKEPTRDGAAEPCACAV
jgi:flagellar assembly factor FliW